MSELEKYQAMLERDPSDTQAFVNLCNIADKMNDYEYLAELHLYRTQVTGDQQEIVESYFAAGEVYLDKLNDVGRGVGTLVKGFELDPTHAGIGDRLDCVYRDADDWEGALQVTEQRLDALATADANGTKVVIRSDLHQQAGEIFESKFHNDEQAIVHYRKAIELDKTNLMAIFRARELYYQAGKYRNAAKLCELEARIEKDKVRRLALYRELAHLLSEKLSDMDQAVVALKRALKIDQTNVDVKMDLAKTIAGTKLNESNIKDHKWASERLLQAADGLLPRESIRLGVLAVMAYPLNIKALNFVEGLSRTDGDLRALANTFKKIVDTTSSLEVQAPVIRRLAKICLEEGDSPDDALAWMQQLEPLGVAEDIAFIKKLELGAEVRASEVPELFEEGDRQPKFATPSSEIDDADIYDLEEDDTKNERRFSLPPERRRSISPASITPPAPKASESVASAADKQPALANGDKETAPQKQIKVPFRGEAQTVPSKKPSEIKEEDAVAEEAVKESVAESAPVDAAEGASTKETPAVSVAQSDEVVSAEPPKSESPKFLLERPAGMSDDDYVNELHKQAEAARRSGDDVAAEEQMLLIVEISGHDQKATTFLERRFRARSDWTSLRDLLRRSVGSPHLPPAVQTVRLREAARLSEEKLGDLDGATEIWRTIQQTDPKVRDAADALKRLFTQTENWTELVSILEKEVASTKSRSKKQAALKRLADVYQNSLGNVEGAADCYTRLLELQPDDETSIAALEELYASEHQYDKLVELLQQRIASSRDRNEKCELMLLAAVTLHERLDKSEQAYEQAKAVLALKSGDKDALELMASIDEESENWERLLDTLSLQAAASKEVGDKSGYLKKKALIANERLGDTREAIRSLREVIAVQSDDLESIDSLSTILQKEGSWLDLVDVLRQKLNIITDEDEKSEIYRQIAAVYEDELGDDVSAMDAWQKVLDFGDDDEALGALSRYHERNGEWDALVDVLERRAPFADNNVERADILFERAKILYDKKEALDDAVFSLKKIVAEVDPSHLSTLDLLRTVLVENERYEEAAEILQQQIDNTTEKARLKELLVTLGNWTRDKLNNAEGSVHPYERAAAMDLSDDDLLDTLDAVYVEIGQWDKLLKMMYGRFQRGDDDDVNLSIVLRGGKICEEQLEDKKQAWTWYRQAFDKLRHLDETLGAVEEAASRMALWNELVDVYGLLTRETKEPDLQVDYWLKIAALFEEKIGDPGKGLEAVLRAYSISPDNKELLDAVDRLSVAAKNWDRLSMVYNALVGRESKPDKKADLMKRQAYVLFENGKEERRAFDVIVKAFEFTPRDQALLGNVEEIAKASGNWSDLVRIYRICASRSDENDEKVELLMRASTVLKDEVVDLDAALASALDVLYIDAFNTVAVDRAWSMIKELEQQLSADKKGLYWKKLIEVYRELVKKNRHERAKQVELLQVISSIYSEQLNDYVTSFEALKEAQQVNPKNENTIDRLEEMASAHGLWENVVDHYRDILDETFEMDIAVMYHRRRARVLAEELNRIDEASEHFWQIIQLDSEDEGAYDQLLRHFELAEKWNELVNLLERRLDSAKDQDKKRDLLLQIAGVWENNIKNKFEAEDWYSQVLALWPDCEAAKEGIERVKVKGVTDAGTEDDDDEDIRHLVSIPPPVIDDKAQDEKAADNSDSAAEEGTDDVDAAKSDASGSDDDPVTEEGEYIAAKSDEENNEEAHEAIDSDDEAVNSGDEAVNSDEVSINSENVDDDKKGDAIEAPVSPKLDGDEDSAALSTVESENSEVSSEDVGSSEDSNIAPDASEPADPVGLGESGDLSEEKTVVPGDENRDEVPEGVQDEPVDDDAGEEKTIVPTEDEVGEKAVIEAEDSQSSVASTEEPTNLQASEAVTLDSDDDNSVKTESSSSDSDEGKDVDGQLPEGVKMSTPPPLPPMNTAAMDDDDIDLGDDILEMDDDIEEIDDVLLDEEDVKK